MGATAVFRVADFTNFYLALSVRFAGQMLAATTKVFFEDLSTGLHINPS
jgi:hypothetical protein